MFPEYGAMELASLDPPTMSDLAASMDTVSALLPQVDALHAELAARHHLRGADATYAAVALMYGTVLVTLDKEQLKRHPEKLRVLNPAAALARLRA